MGGQRRSRGIPNSRTRIKRNRVLSPNASDRGLGETAKGMDRIAKAPDRTVWVREGVMESRIRGMTKYRATPVSPAHRPNRP